MKKVFFTLAVFLVMLNASHCHGSGRAGVGINASNSISSKLSPLTRNLIDEIGSSNLMNSDGFDIASIPEYVIRESGGEYATGALIKVNGQMDEDGLAATGAAVSSKIGDIWTIRVNINNLHLFENLRGIDYIQIDKPVGLNLDKARMYSNVQPVHLGSGLGNYYKGKDVVVGIIDFGFDFAHPVFYDEAYGNYRVKRVWIQSANGSGPSGYNYGTELVNTNDIINRKMDFANISHGTHVAGIAGGGGNLISGLYEGVASECDFVLVSANFDKYEGESTGDSYIVDAIKYIFDYATKAGKPAVVNISLGTNIGPHDGSALFDQACNKLSGPGRIIVTSGGNSGSDPIHIRKSFTISDTIIYSFAGLVEDSWGDYSKGIIDIWGESGSNFCISAGLYGNYDMEWIDDFYCTSANKKMNKIIVGSDGRTCAVSLILRQNEFNGKPRIFVDVANNSSDDFAIAVKGYAGKVHLWNCGTGGSIGYPFLSNGVQGFIDGNSEYTISEIGGTAESVITVGAYVSKTTFDNVSGQTIRINNYYRLGGEADFSAKGPTVDGRIKPDISAPGAAVVSAVSYFDNNFNMGQAGWGMVVAREGINNQFKYAAMQGTSMSSPVVAGIIALMLEAHPLLDPRGIKDILRKSAINDRFTGDLSASKSNIWGWGKVSAFESVQSAESEYLLASDSTEMLIYPNPTDGVLNIELNGLFAGEYYVTIRDIVGRAVYSGVNEINSSNRKIPIDFSGQAIGLYYLNIKGINLSKSFPVIKIK